MTSQRHLRVRHRRHGDGDDVIGRRIERGADDVVPLRRRCCCFRGVGGREDFVARRALDGRRPTANAPVGAQRVGDRVPVARLEALGRRVAIARQFALGVAALRVRRGARRSAFVEGVALFRERRFSPRSAATDATTSTATVPAAGGGAGGRRAAGSHAYGAGSGGGPEVAVDDVT